MGGRKLGIVVIEAFVGVSSIAALTLHMFSEAFYGTAPKIVVTKNNVHYSIGLWVVLRGL